MRKKLQIFISSTFNDLKEERQAAVEAVLNAGHIPAGMELFKAGDQSQKEIIKRWIEESDAYMLILGGRYGTIEEESGKSYTQWEYDYAGELNKPRFAIVITNEALEEKVKTLGIEVSERENYPKYVEFRKAVLEKISKFFNDIKDIKLTVLESLKEFERNEDLTGWVSGKDIVNQGEILNSNFKLLEENQKLKQEIEKLNKQLNKSSEINGYSFEEITQYLKTTKMKLPDIFKKEEEVGKNEVEVSLLTLFISFKDLLDIGIENQYGMSDEKKFFFFQVAPKLMTFNLVEKVKVAGVTYQRIQTSKHGHKFLSIYELNRIKNN